MRCYEIKRYLSDDLELLEKMELLFDICESNPKLFRLIYKDQCNICRQSIGTTNLLNFAIAKDSILVLEFDKVCDGNEEFRDTFWDEGLGKYYIEI